MARTSTKPDDLAAAIARRDAVAAELAQAEEMVRSAEQAARDAGRPVLLAALDKVKIAGMDKTEAKAIATAIAEHGASAVVQHLSTIGTA